jgi:hypothetical protein
MIDRTNDERKQVTSVFFLYFISHCIATIIYRSGSESFISNRHRIEFLTILFIDNALSKASFSFSIVDVIERILKIIIS